MSESGVRTIVGVMLALLAAVSGYGVAEIRETRAAVVQLSVQLAEWRGVTVSRVTELERRVTTLEREGGRVRPSSGSSPDGKGAL